MNILKKILKTFGRKADKDKSVSVTAESRKSKETIMDEEKNKNMPAEEPAADNGKDTVDKKEEVPTEQEQGDGAQNPPAPENNPEEVPAPTVSGVDAPGNGVRVEDVVLKTDLHDAIAALEAKYDALFKENNDLKEKLSEADKDRNELRKKYEEGDFGGYAKQGVDGKNKSANETFEEYSKQFM